MTKFQRMRVTHHCKQTLLLFVLLLSACSIQVSKTRFYEEPITTTSYATVSLKNNSGAQDLLGDVLRKPNNRLDFDEIDGRAISPFQGDTLHLAPGNHAIAINCVANNRIFGKTTITLKTLPGHFYEIAYPSELYDSYNLDFNACRKLRGRENRS